MLTTMDGIMRKLFSNSLCLFDFFLITKLLLFIFIKTLKMNIIFKFKKEEGK